MIRVGLVIVLIAIGAALLGPTLTPYDPASQELARRLEGPSLSHPLGLDELGRDILARVMSGARVSLFVGLIVVSVSASIGAILGSISGYYGGVVDETISRVIDAVLAIPQVQECHMVAGGFDYLLKVRVQDMAAYRTFLSDALASVPGVRSTHTYPVMESVKDGRAIDLSHLRS